MSAPSYGGSVVEAATYTKSWGGSPGAMEVTCPGIVTASVGQVASFTMGGITMSGIVAATPEETGNGTQTRISLVDQRVTLNWQSVFCTFNNVDIRPDDPSTPGIDRQKRFWHILPDDWDAQAKTWTTLPYSAADILRKLLSPFGWGMIFHTDQNKPVYNIDANTGAKLGSVVQRITDEQGLVMTVTNGKTLMWARKGEGTMPSSSIASRFSSGEALSANDTRVRIVGDRNKYQEISVDLEPNWIPELEAFWSEPAWVAEVKRKTGITDEALLAAKAISMTLREAGYKDYGYFGSVCRMEVPVWTYIQNIVFKAYRVPRSFMVNGIGLDDLELSEGLIVATKASSDGTISVVSPREYYPDGKAFVIAKGQQLDLFDPRSKEAISPETLANANNAWSPVTQFQVDAKNKVILFEHPVFASDDLYVFPNQEVSGIGPTNPLHNVAVPNADVSIWAAEVKASLVFEAERFSKTYGSGTRYGSKSVQALSYHALSQGGRFVEEIKYLDGKGADQKADEFAHSMTLQMVTYASGGYTRSGCGTDLNGQIDRVSVSLNFEGGITETVEYAKERSESNFVSEREMERRQGARELYPGQQKIRSDVMTLEAIARVKQETVRKAVPHLATLSQCMETPIGAVDCSPAMVISPDTWLAGQPVLLGSDGKPDKNGKAFAGIVIADSSKNRFQVATQGVVPVRVKGPISVGDAVGIDSGAGKTAKKNGANFLGTANASYAGSDTVLIPVRLGGGTKEKSYPFDVSIIPGSGAGQYIVTVSPGTMNQLLPSNIFNEFTCGGAVQQLKLRGYSNGRSITSCQMILDASGAAQQTPTPFALPSQVDVVVAVIVDGVPFRTIAPGSVTLTGSLQFTTTRDTGGDVSELNATSYYAWVNTSPLPV